MTMYLIEKRGLYYMPKAEGYTGMKKHAGRYSLDEVAEHFPNKESPNQDGMTYVSEVDAPEFSTRCPWDMKLVERTKIKARNDALREAAEVSRQISGCCQSCASTELRILALIGGEPA